MVQRCAICTDVERLTECPLERVTARGNREGVWHAYGRTASSRQHYTQEVPGTESDYRSSVISHGRERSNKISKDSKMCVYVWMRREAAPPTQKTLRSESSMKNRENL